MIKRNKHALSVPHSLVANEYSLYALASFELESIFCNLFYLVFEL